MYLLFESNRKKIGFGNIYFENPIEIISCYKLKDVESTFLKLEEANKRGYFLAGFVSYEAGYAFEEIPAQNKAYDFPLVWFGAFRESKSVKNILPLFNFKHSEVKRQFEKLRLNTAKNRYFKSIDKIKKLIEKGETYQVNYTMKYNFAFSEKTFDLYEALKRSQAVPFSAYIEAPGFTIISLSPELFFQKKNNVIVAEPMKGTIKRGFGFGHDENQAKILRNDSKNRAENIMIVDLIRNDLGKIADINSIKPLSLFDVKRYETLWQMTSKIEAKIDMNISLFTLFSSIFPSGSVTGTPKRRTMGIIKEIEKDERKIYTGAIGYILPNKDMIFSVAIRTLLLKGKNAEMGIGSGIVYDSSAKDEFKECTLKANFLIKKTPEFSLIETILWESGKYFLLDEHIYRLVKSAEYFCFYYEKRKILAALTSLSKDFDPLKKYKVRLLFKKNGEIDVSYDEIKNRTFKHCAVFSKKHTNSSDVFLFHKTTNRNLYNSEFAKYSKEGFFDVLFTNENNEVTEGAISNIFIKKDGKFYTPSIECGLLDGIYRQHIIRTNKNVIEKKIYKNDIENADTVFLCNSVRCFIKTQILSKKPLTS